MQTKFSQHVDQETVETVCENLAAYHLLFLGLKGLIWDKPANTNTCTFILALEFDKIAIKSNIKSLQVVFHLSVAIFNYCSFQIFFFLILLYFKNLFNSHRKCIK